MSFKPLVSNYFKTQDNEQIFYQTNFSKIVPEKPVLIFNYGLVCSNHHWQYQLSFFDDLGYQIIIHDYRGHFQSSGGEHVDKISFKQISHDIKSLCDFLEIKKAFFIGHSMGVNISLQIAKDYPEVVQGLVLISGTFMPVTDVMFDSNLMEFVTPLVQTALEKFPNAFNKVWSSSGMNPIVKHLIHVTGFNAEKVDKQFVEIYLNKVGQLGPKIFMQLFSQMTTQNINPALSRMNMPSLVMGGIKDNVIPNHLQRSLAALLPKSETYFYPTGSHVPQADFPFETNERIQVFLTQNS